MVWLLVAKTSTKTSTNVRKKRRSRHGKNFCFSSILVIWLIVTNATGFSGNDNSYEFAFTTTEKIAESATDYFNIVCSKNKVVIDPNSEHYTYKPLYSYPKIKEYIDYIHVKFPYLRFNFFNNSFELYTERRTSERYYWEQNAVFQKAKEDPGRLEALARRWFPDVEVVWGESRQEQLDNYLQSKGLIGRLLSKEELEAEKDEVARIIGCMFSSWGPKLRQFGYELKDASKNTKAKTYGKKMIEKIDGANS